MALNIRRPETERLATELATIIGETETMAVREALRDRLDRLQRERSRRTLAADLNAIGLHCARQPILNSRPPDEILGYDEIGLPGPQQWSSTRPRSYSILQDEPEREAYAEAIVAATASWMSAAGFVEASMMMESRYGAVGTQDLDLLIETDRIEIVAVDRQQATVARRAFRDFGRDQHPAGLNFGDCFAYALAYVRDERLLAKGDYFPHTDLALVPLRES